MIQRWYNILHSGNYAIFRPELSQRQELLEVEIEFLSFDPTGWAQFIFSCK
jgi:hypothetical protein